MPGRAAPPRCTRRGMRRSSAPRPLASTRDGTAATGSRCSATSATRASVPRRRCPRRRQVPCHFRSPALAVVRARALSPSLSRLSFLLAPLSFLHSMCVFERLVWSALFLLINSNQVDSLSIHIKIWVYWAAISGFLSTSLNWQTIITQPRTVQRRYARDECAAVDAFASVLLKT